ncbi:MAG: hypothetical protein HY011_29795, partial [Acidobacteria bacterium]|nr:hypothetical protein [Acidobacteriota bacterium]
VNSSGNTLTKTEFDPLGAAAEVQDLTNDNINDAELVFNKFGASNQALGSGCYLDGFETTCDSVMSLITADAVEPQAVADARALAKRRPQDLKRLLANRQPDQPLFIPLGSAGYLTIRDVYGEGILNITGGESRGSGNWGPVVEWVPGTFGFGLQGGGQKGGGQQGGTPPASLRRPDPCITATAILQDEDMQAAMVKAWENTKKENAEFGGWLVWDSNKKQAYAYLSPYKGITLKGNNTTYAPNTKYWEEGYNWKLYASNMPHLSRIIDFHTHPTGAEASDLDTFSLRASGRQLGIVVQGVNKWGLYTGKSGEAPSDKLLNTCLPLR